MRAAGIGGLVVLAAVLAAIVVARRTLTVITVDGVSMVPTYKPGDRLLVRRRAARVLRPGDVVLLAADTETATGEDGEIVGRPGHVSAARPTMMVKRVAALAGQPVPAEVAPAVGAGPHDLVPPGSLVVLGDGRQSHDSRHFGYVPATRVVGVVVRRLGSAALSR